MLTIFRRKHFINQDIITKQVRVIQPEKSSIIMPTKEAIALASKKGLDLILIISGINPPVCKMENYKDFLLDIKTQEKELLGKTKNVINE